MQIFRQVLGRLVPRFTPEIVAAVFAALAVALSRTTAPHLWLGLMVMVTAFSLFALIDCTESESESAAIKAMQCQQPLGALAFTFATGCLIACGRPGFASGGFLVMLFYFQIWHLAQTGPGTPLLQNDTYLPDPGSLASFVRSQIPAILRRQKRLQMPLSRRRIVRWLFPLTLIASLLLKMR